MKKKIVLALITATMVGASLTGCGGKTTTDTTPETTQSVEDASNVDETSEENVEDVEDVETVENSTNEDTTDSVDSTSDETAIDEENSESDTEEIDESTILDSEVPDDPEEALKITLAIKDLETRYDYFQKVGAEYLNDDNSERVSEWENITEPYYMSILMMEEIEN